METYRFARRVVETCVKEKLHNVWDVTLINILNVRYRCRVAFTVVLDAEGVLSVRDNCNENEIAVINCLKEQRERLIGIELLSIGVLQELQLTL